MFIPPGFHRGWGRLPSSLLILNREARALDVDGLARLCIGDGQEEGVEVVEGTLDVVCDRLDWALRRVTWTGPAVMGGSVGGRSRSEKGTDALSRDGSPWQVAADMDKRVLRGVE